MPIPKPAATGNGDSSGVDLWKGPIHRITCVLDIPRAISTSNSYRSNLGDLAKGCREPSLSTALISYHPPKPPRALLLTDANHQLSASPRVTLVENGDSSQEASDSGAMMDLD